MNFSILSEIIRKGKSEMESFDEQINQVEQDAEKVAMNLGNILIVDDEKLFAFLLARLLRSRGYKASFVVNAEKALSRLDQEKFDLLIVDIRMDGKSGYEMMKEIREKFGPKSPTFLVGTGTEFRLSLEEMKELKIYKILEKPLPRPSKLFKEIEAAIQSHTTES